VRKEIEPQRSQRGRRREKASPAELSFSVVSVVSAV
jgi:hypothetical protein